MAPRMSMYLAGAASVLATVARAVTFHADVTPVEKVIQLLGRLQEEVQEEGAKEAAEYDKFACFCKEQVDAKTYAIERSEEKIEEMKAEIEKLGTEITELDTEVVALGKRIGELKTEIKTEKDDRKSEYDDYVIADKNVTEAIEAVDAAIKTLQASKRKLGLVQMSQADRERLARISEKLHFAEGSGRALALLATLQEPGKPAAYKYQSNDIIDVLRDLRKTFVADKKASDEAEFKAKSTSEKKVLGLANEQKFKEKSKLEKEELSAEKSAEKEALEKDKTEETTAKEADEAFRTDLTDQCKTKAEEWDKRSTSRAAELTAIAEATEILKSGVANTYGANKKLVGLAALKRQVAATGTAKAVGAPSLLQVEDAASSATVVRRALAALSASAGRLGSSELTALVARADLSEDHFAKVRSLINDLIAKLEAEAESEATQKTFCDGEMKKAVEARDKHQSAVEDASAKLSSEKAKKAQLQEEIAELSQEIADLGKALQEATVLRSEEKEANEKTVADAKAGKTAVEEAISVLKAYYDAALLQQPKADREGKTVSDRAPEMSYEGEYKGKQGASKGVIGLLEVILSDFERTVTTVEAEEKEAQTKFDDFKTETEGSVKSKEEEVSGKEGDVKTAEGEIVSAKDDIVSGKRLHGTALAELEKLKVMCIMGEESFEERKKKREEEIQALKEALQILTDWKA